MADGRDTTAGEKFQTLVEIMARLRAPGGCPWDREQTFDTIKPFLLEETYEVLDAIDRRDWLELRGELGDLLLQAVFFSQMAAEERRFNVSDTLDAINSKLIRRHPHVFAPEQASAGTEGDVRKLWHEIKEQEKRDRAAMDEAPVGGLLDSVPRVLPALVEAQQLSSRAAQAGFDWENLDQVLEKLHEELREFEDARRGGLREMVEAEIGDMLFVLVNLARFVKADAEQALRGTNARFRQRFSHVERRLAEQGKSPAGATLAEMETLWQEAKRQKAKP